MNAEQLLDEIERMAETHARRYQDEDDGANDATCGKIGAKFRACVVRHGVSSGRYSSFLTKLEAGDRYINATSRHLHAAGIPALELWAIVKSTLEGKS